MNNVLSRKHIFISLGVHLGVFLLMAFIIHNNRISKTFLVFGAHSKKPTQAIMKFGHRPYVPFVGGKRTVSHGKHDKGSAHKKVRARAAAPTVVRKEKAVLEKQVKQTKQTALAAGVSVHKKLLIKKLRAEKLKKIRQLEQQLAEKERLAREEQKRQEHELQLAKLEEEIRKKEEALKKWTQEQKAEEERQKLLLAHKEEEEKHKVEDADDDDEGDRGARSSDNIFAQNGQDIMEFNLLAESDQELRVYQRSIQHEVSRLWHPPVGVPKGTTCRVIFAVGRDGCIENFEFVSKSKMLIYDLSILRVAKQFKFDECLWGKRFTIDFCQ